MSEFAFSVAIMPRPGILDPQGRAVESALPQLGAARAHDVRVGRMVELTVSAETAEEAQALVERLAGDFLANPLIEAWEISAR